MYVCHAFLSEFTIVWEWLQLCIPMHLGGLVFHTECIKKQINDKHNIMYKIIFLVILVQKY